MPVPKWYKRAAARRQGNRVKQEFSVAVSLQERERQNRGVFRPGSSKAGQGDVSRMPDLKTRPQRIPPVALGAAACPTLEISSVSLRLGSRRENKSQLVKQLFGFLGRIRQDMMTGLRFVKK
jgi:hypothetical protein